MFLHKIRRMSRAVRLGQKGVMKPPQGQIINTYQDIFTDVDVAVGKTAYCFE